MAVITIPQDVMDKLNQRAEDQNEDVVVVLRRLLEETGESNSASTLSSSAATLLKMAQDADDAGDTADNSTIASHFEDEYDTTRKQPNAIHSG